MDVLLVAVVLIFACGLLNKGLYKNCECYGLLKKYTNGEIRYEIIVSKNKLTAFELLNTYGISESSNFIHFYFLLDNKLYQVNKIGEVVQIDDIKSVYKNIKINFFDIFNMLLILKYKFILTKLHKNSKI